jgi:hypothetical protein
MADTKQQSRPKEGSMFRQDTRQQSHPQEGSTFRRRGIDRATQPQCLGKKKNLATTDLNLREDL